MDIGSLRSVLKEQTLFVLIPLVCAAVPSGYGQSKKSAPATTVLLVDTDDSCRLTVDDLDEGMITPDKSKKISVGLGDHVVKCVIENAPDLVWRKVVVSKGSEQAAAIIALKALHIQYDEAVEQLQQQTAVAEAERQQKDVEEEQRKSSEAQFPERFFEQLKGTWRRKTHDASELVPFDKIEVLDFRSRDGQAIAVQYSYTTDWTNGFATLTGLYSLSFRIVPPNLLAQDGQTQCIQTTDRTRGRYKNQPQIKSPCPSPQDNAQIKVLDSNHLQITGNCSGLFFASCEKPESDVFVKSF
jgi:hypothetical protein